MSQEKLVQKFSKVIWDKVLPRLEKLEKRLMLSQVNGAWCLTEAGVVISNLVFEEMTFLREDLSGKF